MTYKICMNALSTWRIIISVYVEPIEQVRSRAGHTAH